MPNTHEIIKRHPSVASADDPGWFVARWACSSRDGGRTEMVSHDTV